MPELPEVETIRRQAQKELVGAKILSVEEKRSGILRGNDKDLVGKTIVRVRRFAKLLVIDLTGGMSLAVHLKMTGRLLLLGPKDILQDHTHVIFQLNGDKRLIYADYRRFGYLQVVPTAKVEQLPFVKTLGKEPLKDWNLSEFRVVCSKSRRAIKVLLLDQTKISGVGNIYANEALWLAKIHPLTPANQLTEKQTQALFTAIEDVLKEGIKRGGASDNTYRNLFGGKGEYQNFFKVYQRDNQACLRCHTQIKEIRTGGRGTFYCPKCQNESVRE